MAKIVMSLILSFMFVVTNPVGSKAWAQSPEDFSISEASGTRRQMATIIFAGLAGAILGLSTLSFYGRPQDKLSNIAIGFALGIIAGASYTTYKAATQPYDYYGTEYEFEKSQQRDLLGSTSLSQPQMGLAYSWTF